MTGTFEPRMDVLPPAQQRLWAQLRPAASLGFALYGGTAVYFEDGDLQGLTKAERNTLVRTVSVVGDLPVVSVLARQLVAITGGA